MFAGYLQGNQYNGDAAGNTHGKCWLVSLNDQGGIIWQKSYGGLGGEREFKISKTSDNGVVAAGSTTSRMGTGDILHRWDTVLMSNNPPLNNQTVNSDIWVFKINSAGSMLWQKTLGGTYKENFTSIITTVDNGYLLASGTHSSDGDITNPKGNIDLWLVKLKHPLGIDETNTTSYHMQLSPNPNSGSFSLQYELGAAEEVSILLTDSKGRLLRSYRQQGKRGGNTFQINEQGLATGIYFVTLQTAGGKQSLMLQQW